MASNNVNGTVFLLPLGFSKSVTTIAWCTAPLCGTFIYPYSGSVLWHVISISLLRFATCESTRHASLATFGGNNANSVVSLWSRAIM
ncbi:hypothetical protein BKA64DRAFT_674223 [Cadophora sp. MPI-SDFR-AT-0126]|nr:hypothetical protein BKA64DRAFT_674223 [Leotiomycetes sp. MPI-SDFR-AT-0126]